MIHTAVLGYGTIGSGVVEVIEKNQTVLQKKTRHAIDVKYILDLREFPGTPIEKKVIHDFDRIEQDNDVQVVIETMGGMEPAFSFARRTLAAGKAYVTSNKELVARHGAELLALAKANNTNFFFEASVGGGIPVIRPLCSCVTGDVIEEISGILNGTTNYILSRMTEDGWTFEEALKEAQRKGYAERNPEADVEGYDPCRKIAILASLAVGRQVDFEDIYTEGITGITAEDIQYANALNCRIKLLATYKQVHGEHFAMVAPKMVERTRLLSGVSDAFNSISVVGNMLGEAMFYGAGAGKLPTASAVVGDLVDAVNHLNANTGMIWSAEKLTLTAMDDFEQKAFVRMKDSVDRNRVKEAFGTVTEVKVPEIKGEYAFVTELMKEKDLKAKVNAFEEVLGYIRMA